jgi:multiple sugar transport system substrate-binding protein
MTRWRRALLLLVLTALGAAVVGCRPKPKEKVVLLMAGPDWLPTQLMRDISADFPAYAQQKLGYPVEIRFEGFPWGSYYERLTAALAAGTPVYDLFVSDSQWIGDFATDEHILRLNPLLDKDPELKAILNQVHPVLVNAYSTYPEGSQDYYGFPQEADVKGLYVRSDLFSHAGERAAFRRKYGYDLPQTYEEFGSVDWVNVRDFAEFFTRKKGQRLAGETLAADFFGFAMPYSKSYDFLTMGWLQTLYNWGGDIWDRSTGRVEGVLNSDTALASLRFYIGLMQFQPPGVSNYDLDNVNNAMAQGIVAMVVNWIAVGPPVFDESSSKVAGKVMVVVPPGHKGDDGVWRRVFNLGGQPFVVGAKTQHQKEVLEYIKWWFQDDQQWRFARGGGLPSVTSILQDEEFQTLRPWTRAFAEAVPLQQDVWKHPAFFELLTVQQEELHAAVTGTKSPKDALDTVARRQEEILRQ